MNSIKTNKFHALSVIQCIIILCIASITGCLSTEQFPNPDDDASTLLSKCSQALLAMEPIMDTFVNHPTLKTCITYRSDIKALENQYTGFLQLYVSGRKKPANLEQCGVLLDKGADWIEIEKRLIKACAQSSVITMAHN